MQWHPDHPRVCGEKVRGYCKIWNEWGSPPRMRGKDTRHGLFAGRKRITPAYAGKSARRPRSRRSGRDHPRVCGEKLRCLSASSAPTGSPPRMRGKGIKPCDERVGMGITPAYAGKSAHTDAHDQRVRDHPRVCGEKRCPRAPSFLVRGITPAYAGKSSFQAGTVSASRDHPRVCGEKM